MVISSEAFNEERSTTIPQGSTLKRVEAPDIQTTDTPFMTSAARGKADATYKEWQTDALASAVTTNAVIEGDEATLDASTATTRLGNYLQIADKTVKFKLAA